MEEEMEEEEEKVVELLKFTEQNNFHSADRENNCIQITEPSEDRDTSEIITVS